MRDGAAQQKKRAMSVASLSPPTPYTALMSLLSVALSSVTAKSNSMILPDATGVNIHPTRNACSISTETLLNRSGIRAQFRRFGCAISVAYAMQASVIPVPVWKIFLTCPTEIWMPTFCFDWEPANTSQTSEMLLYREPPEAERPTLPPLWVSLQSGSSTR